jgi:hypothetical protein
MERNNMKNLLIKMQIHLMWAVVDFEGRITLQFSKMFSIPMGSAIFETRREAREHTKYHGGKVVRIEIRPLSRARELYNYDCR